LAAALAAGLALALAGMAPAAAGTVTVRGVEMSRFGRIMLEFDQPTKVQVRATIGVLVLSFPKAMKVQSERLTRELSSYLTQVRHDPDGLGLRLALTQPWRTNVLEAAEKVFIDLLPLNWSGLLPALPPEVVDALARRAREAEAKAGENARHRQGRQPRAIGVRVARLPTLTRLVFEQVGGVPVSLHGSGPEIEVKVDALASIELGAARTQVGSAVRKIEADASVSTLRIKFVLEEGYEARGFREDDSFVLDIMKLKPAALEPEPGTEPLPPVLRPAHQGQPSSEASAQPTEAVPAMPMRPRAWCAAMRP
jgi:hypothetical protein